MSIAKAGAKIGETISNLWKGSSKTTKTVVKATGATVASGGAIYMAGSSAGAGFKNFFSGLEEGLSAFTDDVKGTLKTSGGVGLGVLAVVAVIVVLVLVLRKRK